MNNKSNPVTRDRDVVAQYAHAAHIALMHIESIARRFGDVAALREIAGIARETQRLAPVRQRRDQQTDEGKTVT